MMLAAEDTVHNQAIRLGLPLHALWGRCNTYVEYVHVV